MPTYPTPRGLNSSLPSGTPGGGGQGAYMPSANVGGSNRGRLASNDRGELTDAVSNQPLPYDSTKDINQIRALYQEQMKHQQEAFARQMAQQQQFNSLIDPNAGAAQQQQLMELLRQQQAMAQQSRPTNSMALLHGY
jgi:hypothetical protein